MKKLLLFTFLGPLIGVMPIFVMLISKSYDKDLITNLQGFFMMSLYSFQFGVIPAFITGLLAQRLHFNKLSNLFFCVLFAICISIVFIRLFAGNDYLLIALSTLASFSPALVISIFIKWRGY